MAKRQQSKMQSMGSRNQASGLSIQTFPDHLFEPAETTDIPIKQDLVSTQEELTTMENPCIHSTSQVKTTGNLCASTSSQVEAGTSVSENTDTPVTSQTDMTSTTPSMPRELNRTATVPVSVLSPLPKGVYVAGQGKRKPRKKPTVLTSTPNIEETKEKTAPPPVPKKNKKCYQSTKL